jgi:hypothetical protein
MTYNWTEQQIQAATRRGQKKSQEDWLGTSIFRVGNKRDNQQKRAEAPDIRRLMAVLVERDSAFDNEVDVTSEEYKISFNWASKERLLGKTDTPAIKPETPRFFAPGLLSSLRGLNLPSDLHLFIGRDEVKQQRCLFDARLKWRVILDTLSILDETGEIGLDPSYIDHVDKQAKAMILGTARQVAYMYKAFEIGWDDLKVHYPNIATHKGLFVAMLRESSRADYEDLLNPSGLKIYKDNDRIQNIKNIAGFVISLSKKLLEVLPENLREILSKNPLFQGRLDSILKESKALYNRSPWQKEYSEKLIFIIKILSKSPNPEVRKATWDLIRESVGLVGVAQGIIRREINNRTKSNKLGK